MTHQDFIYAINDELVRLGVSQDFYLYEGLSCEQLGGELVICNDHRSVTINPEATLAAIRQLTPTHKTANGASHVWQASVASR